MWIDVKQNYNSSNNLEKLGLKNVSNEYESDSKVTFKPIKNEEDKILQIKELKNV